MFFKMFFGGRGVISTNSEWTRTPSHKEIQRIAWEDGKNSGKLTGTQRTLVLPHVNFSGESVGAPVSLGSAFSPLAGRACRAAVQTGCLQSIVREKGSHKDWEQKKEEQHTRKQQQGERSRTRTSANAGGTNTVHRTIPACSLRPINQPTPN